MVDEPPSPLFQPKDLVQRDPEPTRPTQSASPTFRRDEPALRRDASSYQSAPIASREEITESERKSGWPLALTLAIVGLLAGFAGGYAYRGRSAPEPSAPGASPTVTKPPAPVSREFSEQAVTPPANPAPGSTPSKAAAAPAAASPATKPETPAADAPVPPTAKPAATPSAVNNGSLIVRSTPSSASVTVNGQRRGRTPLRLSGLPLLRYDVRVVQPGYATSREVVTLSAGEPSRALSFRLQRQAAAAPRGGTSPPAAATPPSSTPQTFSGSLYVDSRPRGALVSIDGKPFGVTPLRVPEVRIGTHVVRLELPDHRIWSTTATVTAGQEQRVTGSLERIQ
jgi:PEGA domain